MARNTKKRKNNKTVKNQDQKYQIIGLLLLIFSILLFISLISNEMGMVGTFSRTILTYLFGKVSYLFCIQIAIIGILLVFGSFSKDKWKYIFFVIFIYFAILVLWGIFSQDYIRDDKESLILFSKNFHSGIIGYLFSKIFFALFGKLGSIISLVLLAIIGILVLLSQEQKNRIFYFIKSFKNNIQIPIKKSNDLEIKEPKKNIKKDSQQPLIDLKEEEVEPVFIDYRPTESKDENIKNISRVSENEEENFKNEIMNSNFSSEEYVYPSLDLLSKTDSVPSNSIEDVKRSAKIIEDTMENFNIDCRVIAINHGPSVTCYELQPAPGVRLNRIVALADNLSLSLASPDIRIEAPIPGKSAVGIEVPNKVKASVSIRDILESKEFDLLDSKTPLALGKDVSGKNIISSIDKMPHLLIAGSTGSGKSVCINVILISLLYKSRPDELKLILIDPKVVELGIYNEIPHLLIPVVTDPKKAAFALSWAVDEMEKRYKKFAQLGVRDISGFNSKIKEGLIDDVIMPQIVIVVDELSDLMMVAAKEVEDYITRLAQMARAAGIHLIIATQRPSVDVITGTIKANIPSRIAFSVSSQIDSRTILDMGGAEKLLGKGDMLFYPSSYSKPKRIQGAFVSDSEVENVIKFIKSNSMPIDYNEDVVDAMENSINTELNEQDPLLDEAIKIVMVQDQASISFIQRKLKVGYSRAARIIDQMEEIGIIGPHEGSKPRKLLLSEEEIQKYFEKGE